MAQINFITTYKNNLQNYTFFTPYVHFFIFLCFGCIVSLAIVHSNDEFYFSKKLFYLVIR